MSSMGTFSSSGPTEYSTTALFSSFNLAAALSSAESPEAINVETIARHLVMCDRLIFIDESLKADGQAPKSARTPAAVEGPQ